MFRFPLSLLLIITASVTVVAGRESRNQLNEQQTSYVRKGRSTRTNPARRLDGKSGKGASIEVIINSANHEEVHKSKKSKKSSSDHMSKVSGVPSTKKSKKDSSDPINTISFRIDEDLPSSKKSKKDGPENSSFTLTIPESPIPETPAAPESSLSETSETPASPLPETPASPTSPLPETSETPASPLPETSGTPASPLPETPATPTSPAGPLPPVETDGRVEDLQVPLEDVIVEESNVEANVSSTNDLEILNTTVWANFTYIKLVDDETSCVAMNETGLEVFDCDEAGEMALWEILESEDPALFQLRHVESQLCLAENPEFPDRAFTCWIADDNQAIADTINGLVDCSSPFAAFVGFIDSENPNYLYNAICSTGEVGDWSDVVFMAYTLEGVTQLLWGEKILLDMPEMTANATYTLNGNWILVDA